MTQASIHTPVGDLTVFEEGGYIVALDWGWGANQGSGPLLNEAKKQLHEYFDGQRKTFNLALKPNGTIFQKRVWGELLKIPYGKTISYGKLAQNVNSHSRAIGGACGKNPIPILIPCHRVLAKNGSLGGYSGEGGGETKSRLLKIEGATSPL